jgi:hypothetical protein
MTNRYFRYQAALCAALLLLFASASNASEIRNPFEYGKKPIKKRVSRDSLEVIMISGNRKIAVIGGKEYSVGDMIGEFMLMTVDIDYVEIASSAKTKRLYLNDQL